MKITIFFSPEAETKFTRSFKPNPFVFVITSNSTCYRKHVHCYRSHDLSNYQLWVSAPLNTYHFSELAKNDSPKFSSCHNIGIEYSPKFSLPKLEITNSPKCFPTTILHYTVINLVFKNNHSIITLTSFFMYVIVY